MEENQERLAIEERAKELEKTIMAEYRKFTAEQMLWDAGRDGLEKVARDACGDTWDYIILYLSPNATHPLTVHIVGHYNPNKNDS